MQESQLQIYVRYGIVVNKKELRTFLFFSDAFRHFGCSLKSNAVGDKVLECCQKF